MVPLSTPPVEGSASREGPARARAGVRRGAAAGGEGQNTLPCCVAVSEVGERASTGQVTRSVMACVAAQFEESRARTVKL